MAATILAADFFFSPSILTQAAEQRLGQDEAEE